MFNIYNHPCQHYCAHCPHEPSPSADDPQDDTSPDCAFLATPSALSQQPSPSRYKEKSPTLDLVPDTDISALENRLLREGMLLILSGAPDRATVFRELLRLAHKTTREKWDPSGRGRYVPLDPDAAHEVTRRLKDKGVECESKGLVSPGSESTLEEESLGLSEDRRESGGSRGGDTRVTFVFHESDELSGEVECNPTPRRRLSVPGAGELVQGAREPRISPWQEKKAQRAVDDNKRITRAAARQDPVAAAAAHEQETEEEEREHNSSLSIFSPSMESSAFVIAPPRSLDILTRAAAGSAPTTSHAGESTGNGEGGGPRMRGGAAPTRATTRIQANRLMEQSNTNNIGNETFLPPPPQAKTNGGGAAGGGKKVRRKKRSAKSAGMAGWMPKIGDDNDDADDDRSGSSSKPAGDDDGRSACTAIAAPTTQPGTGGTGAVETLQTSISGLRTRIHARVLPVFDVDDESLKCRLCREMFTRATNVGSADGTAPCSFHPGKLAFCD